LVATKRLAVIRPHCNRTLFDVRDLDTYMSSCK
jgi:hypothetical protein